MDGISEGLYLWASEVTDELTGSLIPLACYRCLGSSPDILVDRARDLSEVVAMMAAMVPKRSSKSMLLWNVV